MVMVFYVNERRAAGETLLKAITDVGPVRFRPIMLTTLTIIAGMPPMMLERRWMSAFLTPMAVSISFGVGFATLVSLLLVPALYLVLDDVAQWWHRRGAPCRRRSGHVAPSRPLRKSRCGRVVARAHNAGTLFQA